MGSSSPTVERFLFSGAHGTVYIQNVQNLTGPHDMALESFDSTGDVWIANDNGTSPIRVYNSSGSMIGGIPASIVPDACGLAFESAQYLWVSDPTNQLIYKVDLTTGFEGEAGAPVERLLDVSSNPFYGSLVITAAGFSDATLEIFDVTGRRVYSSGITGSLTWNGCGSDGAEVPAGTYLIRVSDTAGPPLTGSVVRL